MTLKYQSNFSPTEGFIYGAEKSGRIWNEQVGNPSRNPTGRLYSMHVLRVQQGNL